MQTTKRRNKANEQVSKITFRQKSGKKKKINEKKFDGLENLKKNKNQ